MRVIPSRWPDKKTARTAAPLRGALAGFLLSFFPASAPALTVELLNVASQTPAAEISFGSFSDLTARRTADQLLRIQFPTTPYRRVRLYTHNAGIAPNAVEGGIFRGVSPAEYAVPLRWRSFTAFPTAAVSFASEDPSLWNNLLGIAASKALTDPSAPEGRHTFIAGNPNGPTYVFLGMESSAWVPPGQYRARLVVEEVSDVADITSPTVRHDPVQNLLWEGEPITLEAHITDDVQVASATLHYRAGNETAFTSVLMTLAQNPLNPFEWSAEGTLTLAPDQIGSLSYYFTASDGYNETEPAFIAQNAADLLPAGSEICESIPTTGGQLAVHDGDTTRGATRLSFARKSLSMERPICLKKNNPASLPPRAGRAPVRAFEFGPSGMTFQTPVRLAMTYPDDDQDGVVDGTDIREKDLRLFWHDGFEWRYVGGKVDGAANTVTESLTHFSLYALFPAGAPSADMVRPAEKVFTPNGDNINDTATFNISPPFTIKIFNIQGRKVRELNGFNVWDGRDDGGNTVENGTYVYQLESPELKLSGALAVVR